MGGANRDAMSNEREKVALLFFIMLTDNTTKIFNMILKLQLFKQIWHQKTELNESN